jgi:predicted alpha-1,6-mannanase (GH76 family)
MKKSMLTIGATVGAVIGALVLGPVPAQAFTSSQADDAYQSFVDTYWDASSNYFYTYSDHVAHPEHAHGPDGGVYTDYWWEAQLWEMVLDRYERTGDDAARAMIDDVFDGFQSKYPDFRDNDWNDDIGWWARGSIRAYELTGEARFLAAAEDMFAFIAPYEDTTYGGGIWWKNVDVGDGTKNEKNVATNATAVYTAMRLYAATGTQSYKDTALRLFSWLDTNFNRGGHLLDHVSGTGQYASWDWTYNEGNFAGAALELYLDSGQQSYLDKATASVDWAVRNLTSSGTFLFEGRDDTAGFKSILTRNIRALIDEGGQTQYEAVLTANASQAAAQVNSSGVGWYDWTAPAPELAAEAIQSLAAGATVAVLQQAAPDGSTSVVEGSGVYEAENAARSGIDSESTNDGFTGRGYLAGWIAEGSAVTFHTHVATAGSYDVTLRYAAGAGSATRQLTVNGAAIASPAFAGTSGWDAWTEVVVPMNLAAGHNTITLGFTAAAGSANYLNLDSLSIDLD